MGAGLTMQRNPYLILGVPFGTDRDDARRSFALAARRLRRSPDGPYSVEDLTWALNEIESLQNNPEYLVDVFRVPADPSAFLTHGTGVFRPPAEPMDRRTPPHDPDALEELRRAASVELLQELIRVFSRDVIVDLAYEEPEG